MARMKLPCARAISHPWGRATSTSPSHSRRAVSSSPLAISRNFAVVLTSDSALRGGVTASRAGSSSWFTSLAGQLSLSSPHAAMTRQSTSSSSTPCRRARSSPSATVSAARSMPQAISSSSDPRSCAPASTGWLSPSRQSSMARSK